MDPLTSAGDFPLTSAGVFPLTSAGVLPTASAAPALAAASSPVMPPAGSAASRCCRQVAKSRSSRLEMSLIIPPRPNEASRPVIVKSVTASTRVPASTSCSALTIVAVAPPWPRLSLPLAASVAVWVAASADSTLIVPR